jgi:fructose-1,6-bisphosphatase I
MKFELLYTAFKELSKLLKFKDITLLGSDTESQNSSSDTQKHIDLLANHIIIKAIMSHDEFVGYISEEDEKLILKNDSDGYLVVFDPIDGSKNVKSNITVGTIYSIYDYDNKNDQIKSVVESGYCLYGPSTIMVKTTPENKLEQYLLDENNEFIQINTIERNHANDHIISINMMYDFDEDVKTFLRVIKNKDCTQRWIGAMVADCHQILLNGGTFIYPATNNKPNGKIRLLYEAIPFAHIFSCIDGVAIDTNKNDIMDRIPFIKIKKDVIHRETPIILSNVYTKQEIQDIFELNDIIKC